MNSTQFRNIVNSNRLDHVAQLAEYWISIPNVAGSIPTVAKLTFVRDRSLFMAGVGAEEKMVG